MLRTLKWEREDQDKILKSLIQYKDIKYIFGKSDESNAALAIHQYIGMNEELVESKTGFAIESMTAVKVKWAIISITDHFQFHLILDLE